MVEAKIELQSTKGVEFYGFSTYLGRTSHLLTWTCTNQTIGWLVHS
jgi:hypothetical protein